MNKFLKAWHEDQLNPLDDILARWLLLLGMVDVRKEKVYNDIYQELEELAMKDETLLEAFNAWENLSQTPDTIIAYQSRLKAILDEEARLEDVREKSLEEGIEQGIAKGIEQGIAKGIEQGIEKGIEQGIAKVAQKMIAKGKSNEDIMDATDLTLEEVEALRLKI